MVEYWKSLSPINKFKFIVSVILGIIGVVFATLNWNVHEVHLLITKANMPLTVMILLSMIIGYSFSYIFSYRKFRMKDKEIELLKEEIELLKSKIEE
jgi:uncharacterized integral membrane protein